MSDLDGRMGGTTAGYDIKADWDGQHLHGRIGGEWFGKDITLTLKDGKVEGRIGGAFGGFDGRGEVGDQRVEVRLGGAWDGDDLRLTVASGEVTGRFSGQTMGKDVRLRIEGTALLGRIGGPIDGKDVDLQFGQIPPQLAALAAVCAFKALEDDQSSAAAGSSLSRRPAPALPNTSLSSNPHIQHSDPVLRFFGYDRCNYDRQHGQNAGRTA